MRLQFFRQDKFPETSLKDDEDDDLKKRNLVTVTVYK